MMMFTQIQYGQNKFHGPIMYHWQYNFNEAHIIIVEKEYWSSTNSGVENNLEPLCDWTRTSGWITWHSVRVADLLK